jgi:hypothetical protein
MHILPVKIVYFGTSVVSNCPVLRMSLPAALGPTMTAQYRTLHYQYRTPEHYTLHTINYPIVI